MVSNHSVSVSILICCGRDGYIIQIQILDSQVLFAMTYGDSIQQCSNCIITTALLNFMYVGFI